MQTLFQLTTMLLVLFVGLSGHVAQAQGAPSVDMSASLKEIELNDWQRTGLSVLLSTEPADIDTLGPRVRYHLLDVLRSEAETCRTELLTKEMEPGSPWLAWRSLGRVDRDSTRFWIGSVDCVDVVCGSVIGHERLAIVSVSPNRATIALFPEETPTIRSAIASLDTLSIDSGKTHDVIVAGIESSDDHPCFGKCGASGGVTTYFIVLKGGRIAQAFTVETSSYSGDCCSSIDLRSIVLADPQEVTIDYEWEEWAEETPGQETAQLPTKTAGRLGFRFHDEGFVRVE